jgi:hypothetical protein
MKKILSALEDREPPFFDEREDWVRFAAPIGSIGRE